MNNTLLLWQMAIGAVLLVAAQFFVLGIIWRNRSTFNTGVFCVLTGIWIYAIIREPTNAIESHFLQGFWHWLLLNAPTLATGWGAYGLRIWWNSGDRYGLLDLFLIAGASLALMMIFLNTFLITSDWRLTCSYLISPCAVLSLIIAACICAFLEADPLAKIITPAVILAILPVYLSYQVISMPKNTLNDLHLIYAPSLTVCSVSVLCFGLFLRHRLISKAVQAYSQNSLDDADLLTGLPAGKNFIHLLERRIQSRITKLQHTICIGIYIHRKKILSQYRLSAIDLDELFFLISRRLIVGTGGVDLIGRYYDDCFVLVIQTEVPEEYVKKIKQLLNEAILLRVNTAMVTSVNPMIEILWTPITSAKISVDTVLYEIQQTR